MSVTARRFSPLLIAVVISLSLAGCAKRLVLPISNTARAKAAQVDFSLLAEMARKAGLAYESNGKIQSAYGPGVIVRKDSGSFGQFFLITDETRKTQTLAIRGTNNKYDLGRDLRVRKEKHGGVSYHRGFYAPTIRLYAVLRGFLKKDPAGGAPYPLTITGHSLGGAMGLVLYKHLTENGYAPDQIELFTFGQPKVTDVSSSAKFRGFRITRVINDRDSIPHYPPRHEKNDYYTHVGDAVILWDKATEPWSLVEARDAHKISRLDTLVQRTKLRVRYHKIDKYIRRLRGTQGELVACC